jgi:hypothetical protein
MNTKHNDAMEILRLQHQIKVIELTIQQTETALNRARGNKQGLHQRVADLHHILDSHVIELERLEASHD